MSTLAMAKLAEKRNKDSVSTFILAAPEQVMRQACK